MKSSTLLVHLLLGLLSSLIVATASVHCNDDGDGDNSPLLSTLKDPFTLNSRHPDGAHVVVNGDGTPVVTYDRRLSTVFRLKDGTLSLFTEPGRSAIYGPVGLPLPPLLIPVVFPQKSRPDALISFIAKNETAKGTLTLHALDDGGLRPLYLFFMR